MTDPAGPPPSGPPQAPAVCVRHPDRPTGLRCTRCDRPACPECLREAAVGYQCVDCVAEGRPAARRTIRPVARGPRTPVVTTSLIALNVLVFVVTVVQARSLNGNDRSDLFAAWSLVPGYVAQGEWWRVVTAGFLHYGPLHLLFNMLALWVIGRDMEMLLGRTRLLAVYLVALLGGSAAALLFYGANSEVAGASGAVFGLMGGLAVALRRMRVPMTQVVVVIAINIVLSVTLPGVSLIGHLGGLIVGAVATAALVYAPARNRTAFQAGAIGALTVLSIAVMLLAV
ncbi:Peptidase S54, rhomboid domain protein [Pseudonocardia dioxanivorans CB1190]|uniref:Peptidase S54, rhomboid domain protein n=1 Tax=Pseudonocardia dioxanivorans (strain ATCC 55486 / DSM 44775 / JCM 13855 / CB1190) TaxID=675635 RepID=F4CQE9_PSEUX|nr:rhomboid family intramembrane serine protease [Pseudonocardia dioxanivorans]AEA22387.1 Peptidase S54, rhomboid domain protein [Pseudonocardia dioxanivorans CB1190]GJF02173.1 rhomboid family protein [Pseudonocardia sp. D17]